MLASVDDCIELLTCPVTQRSVHRISNDALATDAATDGSRRLYKVIKGTPVMIDYDRSVADEQAILDSFGASVISRPEYSGPSKFLKKLVSPEHPATRKNVEYLLELLGDSSIQHRVLIIGGGSIGQGMEALYEAQNCGVYSFDIYRSEHSQIVADAHQIPFGDGTFDLVIVQAVLEHVLQPDIVASEIWRVLQAQGLVYAETPFMQHVHEGPYDFTRFSESGHRYLFRKFEDIQSGVVGGAGLQFAWSTDYFFRSVFRSRTIGKVAKLAVFWAQYFDRIIPEKYAIDAASGVFFLGRKSETEMTAKEVITHYKGAQ